MGETRKMHYVPQCYLRYFAQERSGIYTIHALPKNGGEIFATNVKKICRETDLYTMPGATEQERQFLEKMYNDLYEVSYDTIHGMLTDKTKYTVTAKERYSIIGFVVSMFYRNIFWHTSFNNFLDQMLAHAYELAKLHGKDSFFFEDEEISIAGKTLEELQKDNKKQDRPLIALVTAQKIFQLIRLRLINDVITIVKARPGFEFLTSDNPVTIKPADIKHRLVPFDPSNTLSIPIDKNHLLQLRPWAKELDWNMLGRLNDGPFPGLLTSMNNHFQNNQCERFLLGTEAGLKAFKAKPEGIFPPDAK